MQPWERRLNDLWLLLERCYVTYMEPELFRLNTNQFLQTSRTVTFIIQKNKGVIPDFDCWYQSAVKSWAGDKVMDWAKDSRNKIEKEGDLDLYSTLDMTLFWSYIVEQDVKISTGRMELLQAGTKRLVRIARKHLPSGLVNSSAVRVERKWVANTLPDWELLQAFTYIYTTMYRMCQELAVRMGSRLDRAIPDPSELYSLREMALKVSYLKLSDLEMHFPHVRRMRFNRDDISDERLSIIEPFKGSMAKAQSMDGVFEALCLMAFATFEYDGYHVPMMFFYDEDAQVVDMMSMHYGDRVDKYIFWRNAADRMVATKAKMVATIGEAWIRDMSRHSYSESLEKLPIIGERLFVTALDNSGKYRTASRAILRQDENSKPTLADLPPDEGFDDHNVPFYYAPILRALGLQYPKHIAEVLQPIAESDNTQRS
ncbi:hypothetical protein NB717_001751 [Xanthomonas sacchari]|uniref:hypothetical protein n=1 Tax=Xanthomonas sacchari TaxID=56458 RepID=UPI00225DCDFF|nr:hypothetical protein [Xanthomonas sacchari]MCW0460683.1 hypothetical protein [Xanthomonas sacchari]